MWQLWFCSREKPPQDLAPSGGFLLRSQRRLSSEAQRRFPDDAALFAHDRVVAVDLALSFGKYSPEPEPHLYSAPFIKRRHSAV
jgi:hypothetical protein